jgi:hypothetical protein
MFETKRQALIDIAKPPCNRITDATTADLYSVFRLRIRKIHTQNQKCIAPNFRKRQFFQPQFP